jgi:hypothetical protein
MKYLLEKKKIKKQRDYPNNKSISITAVLQKMSGTKNNNFINFIKYLISGITYIS